MPEEERGSPSIFLSLFFNTVQCPYHLANIVRGGIVIKSDLLSRHRCFFVVQRGLFATGDPMAIRRLLGLFAISVHIYRGLGLFV